MELKEAQKKNTEMDDLEEKIDAVTEVLKHGEELANESKVRRKMTGGFVYCGSVLTTM